MQGTIRKMEGCAAGARSVLRQKNLRFYRVDSNRFIFAGASVPGIRGDGNRPCTVPLRSLHPLVPIKAHYEVRCTARRVQAESVHVLLQPLNNTPSQLQLCLQRQLPDSSVDGPRRSVLFLGVGSVLASWVIGLQHSELQAWAAEGITTVFVAGATGNTGRRVVQQLRQAGLSVRAGARSTDKAVALGFGADAGIKIVEADVTKGVDALAAAIGDAQAVVCTTGAAGFGSNGAAQVDEQGTINLVDAALRSGSSGGTGVRKFVLVSSLLTNAAAVGQATNLNYLFLNIFGGVLTCKLKAEKYLRASGLNYTIIRPGGLSNEPESAVGNLIVASEDSLFALDSDPGRVISRDTVAAVAVQAVLQPDASRDKVLEVVASPSVPRIAPELWFSAM